MSERYEYRPAGVCSNKMVFELDGTKINSCTITGGCPGNSIGVAKLIQGKDIDEVISLLEGTRCGRKMTSCPDQIAKALKNYKASL
ncbi:MAG: TIGR03905 family TSCPD domain-containing protein [Solobacterium sp.]|nr:TIGR03905 family TSCPD domain-containing protein [Solobacterium sp.]